MGMEEEIKVLNDFKTGVEKGNDGDIVINLTNMVSNQKASLDALEKANKVLNEENNSLFMEIKDLTKALDRATNEITTLKANQVAHQSKIDSLKKQISILKDSIQKKQMELNVKNGLPEKELTEDEKLQMMIEKEREERRKRREEEERKRKEAEQNNGNG
jgi:chromosome segregation ATPase